MIDEPVVSHEARRFLQGRRDWRIGRVTEATLPPLGDVIDFYVIGLYVERGVRLMARWELQAFIESGGRLDLRPKDGR